MLDPEIDLTTDGLLTRGEVSDRQRSWYDDSDPREIFFPKKSLGKLRKTVVVGPGGLPQISLAEDDGSLTLPELLGEDDKVFKDSEDSELYADALDRITGVASFIDERCVSEGGNRCDRCGRLVRPWDSYQGNGEYPVCDACEKQMNTQDTQTKLISEMTSSPILVEVNLNAFR